MSFNSDRFFDCESAREDYAASLRAPRRARSLTPEERRASLPALEAQIEFLRSVYAPRKVKSVEDEPR